MLTPSIILILLIGPYVVARVLRFSGPDRNMAGVAGLTAVFLFTGVGHFLATEAMVQMIPDDLPQRVLAVQISGVVEIVAALAILIPPIRKMVGGLLIGLLIIFLPVNIFSALNYVPMGGHEWGPNYLLVRVPLQLLLMLWVYRFALEPTTDSD